MLKYLPDVTELISSKIGILTKKGDPRIIQKSHSFPPCYLEAKRVELPPRV